ncbi:hypothetical protein [Sporomusa malonica]|uniref:hypothetical protein n=1 Tax=Sporomusa malonica TaxID=112901 RepID=UPI001593148A|nr:hypothetical protein [Sporomusa malonica]
MISRYHPNYTQFPVTRKKRQTYTRTSSVRILGSELLPAVSAPLSICGSILPVETWLTYSLRHCTAMKIIIKLLQHQPFIPQIRSNGTGSFEHSPEEFGGHHRKTTPSLPVMAISVIAKRIIS